MLCEKRTYRVTTGGAQDFLALYRAEGYPIISRYATLVGCWTHESGVLNSILFIWSYESYHHREQQRAKLAADPAWQAFNRKIVGHITFQESIFLKSVDLS
ncbi:NIPSNAP family protein [Gluconacetobacter azotocaptans]|uniref:NIPSNAP family protein n=1 Tax=Gluconacetobacter azotocaptans TaxID=142834 RepID=A0A7W4PFI7_9PROT|nr:NIPSNAP family protein [Gluconacetobacter azotocaptans]MBB2188956.1 NIPSNAP family protein [Gluconacetobacter azotocaptans]MBM9401472.1 NIPSNAP family protein [Gluconacetobacter azotocaptans]GBQ25913.1 NIPSNAP domain containing protein [Gluconacetobacter azotocaptans DSM 13594]